MTSSTPTSAASAARANTPSPEQIVLAAFTRLQASGSPSLHRLRRGTTLLDAMLEGVFHETKQRLRDQGHGWVPDENLACAFLLAPLVKEGKSPLGKTLSKNGFSELRFRQLVASETPAELFTALQRALRQVDSVSPHSVLRIALRWTEYGVDDVRKRLLADYFGVELPGAVS